MREPLEEPYPGEDYAVGYWTAEALRDAEHGIAPYEPIRAAVRAAYREGYRVGRDG